MKFIDLTELTHYMSPKSRLFWQNEADIVPVANVKFATTSPNLVLVPGDKAMTLSQLTARLQDMSPETQLFSPDAQPIFGFHLQLTSAAPEIILK